MSDGRGDEKVRQYSNDDITVIWKPSTCIHVTTCYRELIEVFNPRKRPWVNMQGASTEEIIRVVNLCPTDALTYKWNDKTKQDQTKKEMKKEEPIAAKVEVKAAEVRVMRDGPLLIKGKFKIVDSGGNELKQMKMASFCRCGHSQRMPFCDGTHRKIDFSAE
jgi:uncharacterized Fe-S cluster protein YjdI